MNQHTVQHCTGNQQTLQQSTEINKQYNTVQTATLHVKSTNTATNYRNQQKYKTVQTATNNVLSLRNVIIGKR